MNIYRKLCVVFLNFNNKLIRGIKFGKKKLPNKVWQKVRKSISFHHSLKSKEMKHLESKCLKVEWYHRSYW